MSDEATFTAGDDAPGVRSDPAVLYAVEPPVAVITLNRADRCNALSAEVVLALHGALDLALDAATVRAVIITGDGGAFCSGLDLHEAMEKDTQSHEERLADADALGRLLHRVRSFEKVTIAAVNGPALASGCALATCCDFTVATGSARFGHPEVRHGFVPAVAAVYLRHLVNQKLLRELLLTGRILSADEAKQLGLVNKVLPAGDLLEGCKAMGAQIAENAPGAIQRLKELLEQLPGMETDRALKAAVEVTARTRAGDEAREGVRSFVEKRDPAWTRPGAGDAAAEAPPPADAASGE